MLVLSRKLGETLMIGGEITVRVIEVKGNTVRLGIDAPRQVPVLRSELRSNGQRSTADCL